ncbi:hypothetical protein [Burkholderia sp. Ac-20365]|uniref:hypothetical protein n=1 Tax=Burkholderia sp. Ac-20365 TaxID=2703897 RepID=UPI00197C5A36|nr:hypothetical protein [Burkholderia sp. Ac-20365]MBN3760576.1 hypothetical protein [Burkholderia sp. Ac-20365]
MEFILCAVIFLTSTGFLIGAPREPSPQATDVSAAINGYAPDGGTGSSLSDHMNGLLAQKTKRVIYVKTVPDGGTSKDVGN